MAKWILALAALLTAAFTPPPPGVDDPPAFVRDVFATYAEAPNRPPAEPRYAYSARLGALFTAYEEWGAAHDDLVGSLDFDWWVNAQDWEIGDVNVTGTEAAPERRVVTARWRNYDRTDSSRFVFLREHGLWVLDDVINGTGGGDDGWTLSELLKQRPE